MTVAAKVVKVNVITITFIKISSNLYFPIFKMIKQRLRITIVQTFTLMKSPNSDVAIPAVTIVTAA